MYGLKLIIVFLPSLLYFEIYFKKNTCIVLLTNFTLAQNDFITVVQFWLVTLF